MIERVEKIIQRDMVLIGQGKKRLKRENCDLHG